MIGKKRNLALGGDIDPLVGVDRDRPRGAPAGNRYERNQDIARNDSHSSIQEVPAASRFYYNISVINPDPVHHAVEVVVTDKLPYDAAFESADR